MRQFRPETVPIWPKTVFRQNRFRVPRCSETTGQRTSQSHPVAQAVEKYEHPETIERELAGEDAATEARHDSAQRQRALLLRRGAMRNGGVADIRPTKRHRIPARSFILRLDSAVGGL